ncbi:hypothetical protein RN001_011022 [Aquatica leii]|uniref:Uncharacterized protein n=1 Tax=Aquatica leii TaxID=1421715 RepID=A0AAN7PAJ4_9COLE|nr:hypothetical protein RN001_011022 [Aquatica leii]
MDLTLNAESFAYFSNARVLTTMYRNADNPTPTVTQNFNKVFNTLDVTSPVFIPRPLSDNYLDYKRNLPIYKHKDDFLKLLLKQQVVMVAAENSTQKSTQIPQFILDDACERKRRCRIICTQPNQLSTFYLSSRVAEERGEYLGSAVGNQIKMRFQYGLSSGLIYCTNDIIVNTLMHHNKGYMCNITHIIIDDVHEHDAYCDLLLVFLKEFLKTNKKLKVVLMTTQANVGQFFSYFDNCTVYPIEEITTNINQFFLDDVLKMFYTGVAIRDDSLFETIMHNCMTLQQDQHFEMLLNLIYANNEYANKQSVNGLTPLIVASITGKYKLVRLLISLGAKLDGSKGYYNNNNIDVPLIRKIIIHVHKYTNGATLVFLPNYEDLLTTKESLLLSLPMDVDQYEIVLMYDTMDPRSCKRALEPCIDKHKIILATSAVQGNVLIPNVSYVIDTGRVEVSNGATTNNTWISQETALDRAKKADKTCFHLYTKEFYQSMRKDESTKMPQSPLHGFCLRTKVLSKPGTSINDFFKLLPKPPPATDVDNAVEDLVILGALNVGYELTVLGSVLSQLSMEPRLGKILIYSVIFKCLDPILTIVASLCYKNPIILPQNVDVNPLRGYYGAFLSDHLVLLRVYQDWQKFKIRGELLAQLRGTGFVNLQITGKTRELNENSDRWPIVKAVLTAGCDSNIYFIEDKEKVSFSKSSVLGDSSYDCSRLCVIHEDAMKEETGLYVQFGTVVTPLTVALMYDPTHINNLNPSKFNLKLFVSVLKELINKKIDNPSYEFNKTEMEFFAIAQDAVCMEDYRYKLPQPNGVGVMPRLFLNVRAKSTQQQLYELYGKHGISVDHNDNASAPPPQNLNTLQRTVFFIIKSPNYKCFYNGVTAKTWIFGQTMKKKLFVNTVQNNMVKLFFSVSESNHFQGVAELVTNNDNTFHLSWISIKMVSFEEIRMNNLKNIYDDDRLVCEGDDGQEIEYETGLQLLNMFL